MSVRVGIWGFGAMGRGIAKMLHDKRNVTVVGVCDNAEELLGKKLEEFGRFSDVTITDDIERVFAAEPDVLFHATDSFTADSYPKVKKALENGIDVISTAEEMAYPYANEPALAESMDQLAKENGARVLGTGINPGFVMDLLAIALSGAVIDIDRIEVERVNSLSPFGPTVMREQGVGLSLEVFRERQSRGELAGHVGFKESVHMIAKALGYEISRFEQQMEPIVTSVDRKSPYGEAKAGHVAGIDMKAQGYVGDEVFIDMRHPQQIEPEAEGTSTGDYILIKGTPEVNLSIRPEIEGGLGTIATCVNAMPLLLEAEPGLKTMIDLPVPRAFTTAPNIRKN